MSALSLAVQRACGHRGEGAGRHGAHHGAAERPSAQVSRCGSRDVERQVTWGLPTVGDWLSRSM